MVDGIFMGWKCYYDNTFYYCKIINFRWGFNFVIFVGE